MQFQVTKEPQNYPEVYFRKLLAVVGQISEFLTKVTKICYILQV